MIIFVVQLGGVIKNTCLVVPNFSMTPIPKSIFFKLFFSNSVLIKIEA